MIERQAKSDQKHATATRPIVAALRIGEKSAVSPRTISDYANEKPFVSILAIRSRYSVIGFEAYEDQWLIARESVTFLIGFIARFRAYNVVGLERHKVEAALQDAVLGHSFESHTVCDVCESPRDSLRVDVGKVK